MTTSGIHHHRPTRRSRRQLSFAVVFVCVVSIALLITGAVVEGTPAVLVAIPTIIGALTIATMPHA